MLRKGVSKHTGTASNGGVSWSSVAADLNNKFTWHQVKQKWNEIAIVEIPDDGEDDGKQEETHTQEDSSGHGRNEMQMMLQQVHESNMLMQRQLKQQQERMEQLHEDIKSTKIKQEKDAKVGADAMKKKKEQKKEKKHKRKMQEPIEEDDSEGSSEDSEDSSENDAEEEKSANKRKRKKKKGMKRDKDSTGVSHNDGYTIATTIAITITPLQ